MKLLVYDNAATGVYTGLGQDLAAGNSTDLFAHSVSNLGFITFGKIGTNGTTYTEWARFNTSGYLGIGTTSPAYLLDVSGDMDFYVYVSKPNLQDKKCTPIRWVIVMISSLSAFLMTLVFFLYKNRSKELF